MFFLRQIGLCIGLFVLLRPTFADIQPTTCEPENTWLNDIQNISQSSTPNNDNKILDDAKKLAISFFSENGAFADNDKVLAQKLFDQIAYLKSKISQSSGNAAAQKIDEAIMDTKTEFILLELEKWMNDHPNGTYEEIKKTDFYSFLSRGPDGEKHFQSILAHHSGATGLESSLISTTLVYAPAFDDHLDGRVPPSLKVRNDQARLEKEMRDQYQKIIQPIDEKLKLLKQRFPFVKTAEELAPEMKIIRDRQNASLHLKSVADQSISDISKSPYARFFSEQEWKQIVYEERIRLSELEFLKQRDDLLKKQQEALASMQELPNFSKFLNDIEESLNNLEKSRAEFKLKIGKELEMDIQASEQNNSLLDQTKNQMVEIYLTEGLKRMGILPLSESGSKISKKWRAQLILASDFSKKMGLESHLPEQKLYQYLNNQLYNHLIRESKKQALTRSVFLGVFDRQYLQVTDGDKKQELQLQRLIFEDHINKLPTQIRQDFKSATGIDIKTDGLKNEFRQISLNHRVESLVQWRGKQATWSEMEKYLISIGIQTQERAHLKIQIGNLLLESVRRELTSEKFWRSYLQTAHFRSDLRSDEQGKILDEHITKLRGFQDEVRRIEKEYGIVVDHQAFRKEQIDARSRAYRHLNLEAENAQITKDGFFSAGLKILSQFSETVALNIGGNIAYYLPKDYTAGLPLELALAISYMDPTWQVEREERFENFTFKLQDSLNELYGTDAGPASIFGKASTWSDRPSSFSETWYGKTLNTIGQLVELHPATHIGAAISHPITVPGRIYDEAIQETFGLDESTYARFMAEPYQDDNWTIKGLRQGVSVGEIIGTSLLMPSQGGRQILRRGQQALRNFSKEGLTIENLIFGIKEVSQDLAGSLKLSRHAPIRSTYELSKSFIKTPQGQALLLSVPSALGQELYLEGEIDPLTGDIRHFSYARILNSTLEGMGTSMWFMTGLSRGSQLYNINKRIENANWARFQRSLIFRDAEVSNKISQLKSIRLQTHLRNQVAFRTAAQTGLMIDVSDGAGDISDTIELYNKVDGDLKKAIGAALISLSNGWDLGGDNIMSGIYERAQQGWRQNHETPAAAHEHNDSTLTSKENP